MDAGDLGRGGTTLANYLENGGVARTFSESPRRTTVPSSLRRSAPWPPKIAR